MSRFDDSIYALSSGALPAGVAVIRISGSRAFEAAAALAGAFPADRRVRLRWIRDRDGALLDHGLVIGFAGPSSFTGEDCVELHLHGSRAVVSAVLAALGAIPGLRAAEAGEFTRRAFENGRLDLVEAEGLADLLAAETQMQRRLAVEQGFGGQSQLYGGWAERLTRARALIEAEIDFADEDDVPGSVSDRVWRDMRALHGEIATHIAGAKAGEIIRDGYKVVLAGPPNAGKSSLLNALANRDVAIVTEIAGTTRDILHVDVDLEGYLVRFFDTAGLRESSDIVEQEGIRRARIAMEQADLVLQLSEIDSASEQSGAADGPERIQIGTKLDKHEKSDSYELCLSAATGEGLDELRGLILDRLRDLWSGSTVPGRVRQIAFLQEALHGLEEALNGEDIELRAENLRSAATSLGRITGRVDVEQLLDVIFSQFCIGK